MILAQEVGHFEENWWGTGDTVSATIGSSRRSKTSVWSSSRWGWDTVHSSTGPRTTSGHRKARLLRAVTELSQAFALSVPHDEALRIRDDVGCFQAVRAVLAKGTPGERKTDEVLDLAIRQIVSKAVASDEVIDVFTAAGLNKPDLSILSDEFLADERDMPPRNLAVELLQKLLSGEIKKRSKRNVVQARPFANLLEQAVRKYQNRAIKTAQLIEEFIQLAKDIREAAARGKELGLTEDELAFYDALEANDSAVKVLGDDKLRLIARELVETVRKDVTIDWTVRENGCARC